MSFPAAFQANIFSSVQQNHEAKQRWSIQPTVEIAKWQKYFFLRCHFKMVKCLFVWIFLLLFSDGMNALPSTVTVFLLIFRKSLLCLCSLAWIVPSFACHTIFCPFFVERTHITLTCTNWPWPKRRKKMILLTRKNRHGKQWKWREWCRRRWCCRRHFDIVCFDARYVFVASHFKTLFSKSHNIIYVSSASVFTLVFLMLPRKACSRLLLRPFSIFFTLGLSSFIWFQWNNRRWETNLNAKRTFVPTRKLLFRRKYHTRNCPNRFSSRIKKTCRSLGQ